MAVSAREFEQLALNEPNQWELYCGEPRRKPGMTYEHNFTASSLYLQLGQQLDGKVFQVRLGMGHVRRSEENYFIPDVYVIPVGLTIPLRGTRKLEVYSAALPLVVEVWSPSTGTYDVDTKIPEYQRRGDLEIWRLHPYDHTLTCWRKQPEATYLKREQSGGTVQPAALPNVTVDLDALFE
jgi:Uma2 family endonuclease